MTIRLLWNDIPSDHYLVRWLRMDINGKQYEVIKHLTFGQMKRINKSFGEGLKQELLPDLTLLQPEEVIKMAPKIENQLKFNSEQLDLVGDLIKYSLDYSDEQLENIPFEDVEKLYLEIIKENQPKKKLEQQYG